MKTPAARLVPRLLPGAIALLFPACHNFTDDMAGRVQDVIRVRFLPEAIHHRPGTGYALEGKSETTTQTARYHGLGMLELAGRKPPEVVVRSAYLFVPEGDVTPQLERLERIGERADEPGRTRDEIAVLNQVGVNGYEARVGRKIPYPMAESLPEGYALLGRIPEGAPGRVGRPVSEGVDSRFEHPGWLILSVPLDAISTVMVFPVMFFGGDPYGISGERHR